jgi:hypothetical protein
VTYLSYLLDGVAFLFAVMTTTALAGRTVQMGKKHAGKTLWKEKSEWASYFLLSSAYLFEALVLSVSFLAIEWLFRFFLDLFVAWLPSIISEALFLYYVWFTKEFDYKFRTHWRYLVFPQVILGVNVVLALYAPWVLEFLLML